MGWQDRGQRAFQLDDWDSAIDAYTNAVRLDESLAGAYAGRGGAYLRKGDASGALADLDQALKLEPDNLFASRDRAEARLETGTWTAPLRTTTRSWPWLLATAGPSVAAADAGSRKAIR